MELHDLYTNVVKARPELEVPRIVYKPRDGKFNNVGRWLSGTTRLEPAWVESMIESHWLRVLHKDRKFVYPNSRGWFLVGKFDPYEKFGFEGGLGGVYETAIECLAEYLVPGSTREAKP